MLSESPMSRILFVALLLASSAPVLAQEGDEWLAYGKALVEANCAVCHAVGATGESRHAEAPPFRVLMERYPIDALEESFVEGITVGHPDMPEFIATPEQIAAIIDYIASLDTN